MTARVLPFARGSLPSLLVQCTAHALACCALLPIETEQTIVTDHGVPFLIRTVSSLRRKNPGRTQRNDGHSPSRGTVNPFLPYERDLLVAGVSNSHLALLNKYKVIDHHLLLITRAFEHQETPLTPADFDVLWRCMVELDALGFYNAGMSAGASQPHKHLQMVPLPLDAGALALPIEPTDNRRAYLRRNDPIAALRERFHPPCTTRFRPTADHGRAKLCTLPRHARGSGDRDSSARRRNAPIGTLQPVDHAPMDVTDTSPQGVC